MIRILFFLIVVFALGLGFAWLADRPGDMVVTFSGYQYQVSLMVAAVAVTAVVAAVMIAVVAGQGDLEQPLHDRALFPRAPARPRLPGAVDRHDRGRRRRRGRSPAR